jgi:hypothetical protein
MARSRLDVLLFMWLLSALAESVLPHTINLSSLVSGLGTDPPKHVFYECVLQDSKE